MAPFARLQCFALVAPKLRAIDGVERLTMKKQISSFIIGALFGGILIFTMAADSRHPAAWDYKVVYEALKYNQYQSYSDALNEAATNGWEVVSSQVFPNSFPNSPGEIAGTERVGLCIVLRHPKQ